MSRTDGSKAIRRAALLRDRGLCCNCRQPADHTHHIVPISLGGQDVLSNVVAICQDCHGKVHESPALSQHHLAREGRKRAEAAGVKFGRRRTWDQGLANTVRTMRAQGTGYGTIATALGITASKVRRILEAAGR